MKIQTVLLLFLLILPFLEIFQINQIHAFTRVLLIALSLLLWSTFGYWKFLHKVTTGKVIFLALLILISILFQRFVL
jgi:hypothetical protein